MSWSLIYRIEAQLLDSHFAFMKGRRLTDALFIIRQVIS